MGLPSNTDHCDQTELISDYVLGLLVPAEAAAAAAHLSTCPTCMQRAEAMHRVRESFAAWPIDVLRPPTTLWNRLLARIGETESGVSPSEPQRSEPPWEEVGGGISCKILSSDTVEDRVAMLVRLEPGALYPPHTHSGVEELHLLSGELWIDEKQLHPGDYNRAERGTSDRRVWSETGCTCLLITAPSDVLG